MTEQPSTLVAPHGIPVCRTADSVDELNAHWSVRHQVFVAEQQVFEGSDRDRWDSDRRTVHCVGLVNDRVVGAVRLYPVDRAGIRWQGDRLAVLPQWRSAGLGGPLVRLAVRLAGAHGGRSMQAHIQVGNVRFFEHLGWNTDGPTEVYLGIPHQPMEICW